MAGIMESQDSGSEPQLAKWLGLARPLVWALGFEVFRVCDFRGLGFEVLGFDVGV